jgi:hypothetical protein
MEHMATWRMLDCKKGGMLGGHADGVGFYSHRVTYAEKNRIGRFYRIGESDVSRIIRSVITSNWSIIQVFFIMMFYSSLIFKIISEPAASWNRVI